jgi:hypothetical protein
MAVRIDHSWHEDAIGRIDLHRSIRDGELASHRCDLVGDYKDISAFNDTK